MDFLKFSTSRPLNANTILDMLNVKYITDMEYGHKMQKYLDPTGLTFNKIGITFDMNSVVTLALFSQQRMVNIYHDGSHAHIFIHILFTSTSYVYLSDLLYAWTFAVFDVPIRIRT